MSPLRPIFAGKLAECIFLMSHDFHRRALMDSAKEKLGLNPHARIQKYGFKLSS